MPKSQERKVPQRSGTFSWSRARNLRLPRDAGATKRRICFAGLENIADHAKKWTAVMPEPHFSVRHCQRILRDFRDLGVIGARTEQKIRGVLVEGFQLRHHASWTKQCGDCCELRFQERLALRLTGEVTGEVTRENVVPDVVANVVPNVVQNGQNVVVIGDIFADRWLKIRQLHRRKRG